MKAKLQIGEERENRRGKRERGGLVIRLRLVKTEKKEVAILGEVAVFVTPIHFTHSSTTHLINFNIYNIIIHYIVSYCFSYIFKTLQNITIFLALQ